MSDLQLPDRLAQLRSRWEADPASRIFLQLAEEYRHLGRLNEALSVLDAGLKEHPGYLSALVAKGRCLLELGQPEPAREVLERVVRQDATQAVANKLLVRAYLDTGQADRARERLDLYSLLHDGDPEIEELRGRIRRLDASGTPAPARPEPQRPEPARTVVSAPPDAGDVFKLDYPPAPRRAATPALGDVFELDYPPAASATSATLPSTASTAILETPEPEPLAAVPQAVAPAEEAQEAPEALDEPEPTPEGEPFPGLVSRAVRHRYLAGLAAEGLFAFTLDLTPAAAAAPAEPELFDLAPLPEPEPAAPEPIHAPGEIFPLRSIGEAVEAELWRTPVEPEPEAEMAPEPEMAPPPDVADVAHVADVAAVSESATVTLGDLYLRQGHVGEAEQIFQEVLRREPENTAAREALAQVASSREEPVAASAVPVEPAAAPGDRRARKVQLLTSYLQRIRRGSQPDVS